MTVMFPLEHVEMQILIKYDMLERPGLKSLKEAKQSTLGVRAMLV